MQSTLQHVFDMEYLLVDSFAEILCILSVHV